MNKRVLAIIAPVIFLVAGCSSNTANGNLEKVTIAEFGEVFLYAPLYIADEKGYFEQEGLDVTITPTGGDEKTFAALLSGDAQFGVADPTFVAISGEKGQPGKVIASIVRGVPFWGVAKMSVPEIKTPSDLKDYNVATFPAPSTAYTLQKKMFESAGLDPNITEAAFGSLLAALESGNVDIALELEPNVSLAVKNGNHVVYGLPDVYPDFALTGLTVLPAYLDANPATAQKVVNALQKAMTFIKENPAGTAEVMAGRFPEVELSVAQDAIENMSDSNVVPQNAIVDEAGWDAAIQLRRDAGDLKNPAPYADYVITTFAEAAK